MNWRERFAWAMIGGFWCLTIFEWFTGVDTLIASLIPVAAAGIVLFGGLAVDHYRFKWAWLDSKPIFFLSICGCEECKNSEEPTTHLVLNEMVARGGNPYPKVIRLSAEDALEWAGNSDEEKYRRAAKKGLWALRKACLDMERAIVLTYGPLGAVFMVQSISRDIKERLAGTNVTQEEMKDDSSLATPEEEKDGEKS